MNRPVNTAINLWVVVVLATLVAASIPWDAIPSATLATRDHWSTSDSPATTYRHRQGETVVPGPNSANRWGMKPPSSERVMSIS